MVQIDVQKFLSIPVQEITESLKDEYYPQLCELNIESISPEFINDICRLMQEVMKFKGEQVDSLVAELDLLASKQGEEEAYIQSIHDEMEELRSKLSATSTGNKTPAVTDLDADGMRREIVKMEITNDRLISELQEKEEELITEKKEIENLSTRITVLEEENKSLKEELLQTKQELTATSDSKLRFESPDQPSIEKYHELTELLRQKNKHISQLLQDIEEIEKENMKLKERFSVVKEEMIEGTEHMAQLSAERIQMTTVIGEMKEKISSLEHENTGLRNQIAELVLDKETQDKQLENLSLALDSRIQQWKEILDKKDSEINSLKSKINEQQPATSNAESAYSIQFNALNETLEKQEKQIEELKSQLKQATVDLNESAMLLEQQRLLSQSKATTHNESNLVKQLRKKLEQNEGRITLLEGKLKHAEDDALKKAEEVTELIMQLREYESGTYGLEDAVTRIKELQKQKDIRDKHIEQLIQASNKMQDELNELEQENIIMRGKLGIPLDANLKIENSYSNRAETQSRHFEFSKKIEQLSEQIITLKLENRKLQKLLNEKEQHSFSDSRSSSVAEEYDEPVTAYKKIDESSIEKITANVDESHMPNDYQIKDRLNEIIDENEGLRKGMQEILDSIRHQDGTSNVLIESECLQNLLEVLDSRHVSGWYQPGMRLQARIQLLYGINQALREELHTYRNKNAEYIYEIQNLNHKVQQLDKQLCTQQQISSSDTHVHTADEFVQNETPLSDESRKYENELKSALEERDMLQIKLNDLTNKISTLEETISQNEKKFDEKRELWEKTKLSLEKEIEKLVENEDYFKIKISEYEKHLEVINEGPDAIKKTLAENTLRISALKVEQEQTKRKNEILLKMNSDLRREYNNISEQLSNFRSQKEREILLLKTEKEKLAYDLTTTENLLRNCADHSTYQNVCNDFTELTIKYRDILHKINLSRSDRENLIARLENELLSMNEKNQHMRLHLQEALAELNILKQSSIDTSSIPSQVAELTKKVAAMEVDVMNSKQHSDHTSRMYDLLKEQLNESENRCSTLENKYLEMTEIVSKSQQLEAELTNKFAFIESENKEFKVMRYKLQDSEKELACLRLQNNELQNLVDIVQEQVRSSEHQRRLMELEYDSLQRRILELQSVSEEKMIIDRLTQEISSLQKSDVFAKDHITFLDNKILVLESKLAHTVSKLEKTENDFKLIQQNDQVKIKNFKCIIHELQKRFMGALPLITEELWSNNLLRMKESYNNFMTKLTDVKCVETSLMKNEQKLLSPTTYEMKHMSESYIRSTQQKVQELNMRILNEGLNTKLQVYEERLEKQERLISRLEEEIIHFDTKCQEFLLQWNDADNNSLTTLHSKHETDTKSSQTTEKIRAISLSKDKSEEESKYAEVLNDLNHKLNQSYITISELNAKIKENDENQMKLQAKLIDADMALKEREQATFTKNREIMELQNRLAGVCSKSASDDPVSVDKLALKATVESLQNIIDQKEATIKRYQNLLKDCREEYAKTVGLLQKEIKHLQTTAEANQQAFNRTKMKLENLETDSGKPSVIDSYITRIHELEDELSQSTDKINQLTNQLMLNNQRIQQQSVVIRSADEKRKDIQIKNNSDTFKKDLLKATSVDECEKLNIELAEKIAEIENLRSSMDELKKKLLISERSPSFRDRLRVELDKCKKRIEIMEQKENDYKIEIQRLKNQLHRPQSATRKEQVSSTKEEQLQKRIKELDEQVKELRKQKSKWDESKRIKCDEEVEKWQMRKRFEQNIDKLKTQIKELSEQAETLRTTNDRLRETIVRLEREKINLENKLKSAKGLSADSAAVEELQKEKNQLEEEIRVLRRSAEHTVSNSSVQELIETQERKIMTLETARKGDAALAEELERVHERKSQLQKSNLRLEEEILRLKLENEKLKTIGGTCVASPNMTHSWGESNTDNATRYNSPSQLKTDKKRIIELERTVIVLKRLIEKLQAENKRLHCSKVSQLQDKNYVEKLQTELQQLHHNYLDAIEKVTNLEDELKEANCKIESLQKLIRQLENGEEMENMKFQMAKKNQLLSKIKVILEKTATREKDLTEKVTYLQNIISSAGIPIIT